MWFAFLLLFLGVLIAAGSRLLPSNETDKGSDPAPATAEGTPPAVRHGSPIWYHVLTWGLVVFGMLGMASIGMAFLLVGVTLAVLGPQRNRPAVFWPPIIAEMSLITTFVLIAPFSCAQTASTATGGTSTVSPTVCTNLIGIEYSGLGGYNPPLMPALLISLATAVLAGFLSRRLLQRDKGHLAMPKRPQPG